MKDYTINEAIELRKRYFQRVNKGREDCNGISCSECLLGNNIGNCCWLSNKGYAKVDEFLSKVDWSKVPVDTKVLVSDDNKRWVKRHFAKYENGWVYTFFGGATSWSADDDDLYDWDWNYAKLAEEDNNG